jgi:hypothetical protein
MSAMPKGVRRRLAAAALVLAAAWSAPASAQGGSAAPQVRAVAAVAAGEGGPRVELRLARAPSAPAVGSFSGELRFDPGTLTLDGGEVPAGLLVLWNQVEPGRVRFAGASTEGFGDGAVLVLRFRGRGAVPADAFRVRLEEAFGVNARVRLAP